MSEELLAGGATSRVVRVGDTVRRPTGPWTPTIHALLRHLEDCGFPAPRVLGIDGEGREILSYIDGRPGTRPWLDVLLTLEGVRRLTRFVLDYHVCVAGFDPGPEAEWRIGRRVLQPGELVLHGDVSPYNSIWRSGQPVALIDWDFAQPGNRLRDVAQLAWQLVPLRQDEKWRAAGFLREPDFRRRLEVLCETYGLFGPGDIVQASRDYLLDERMRTTQWGAAGHEPWMTFLTRGDLEWIDADLAWLDAHRSLLVD